MSFFGKALAGARGQFGLGLGWAGLIGAFAPAFRAQSIHLCAVASREMGHLPIS